MKTLKVPDMHCEKCVSRIADAFKREGIECEISLENKTVAVPEEKIAPAIETLDDLGFDAAE